MSTPDIAELAATYSVIAGAEAYATHREWFATRRDAYQPATAQRLAEQVDVPAHRYVDAQRTRRRLGDRLLAHVGATADVLLTATTRLRATPIGMTEADGLGVRAALLALTSPFNVTDRPAVSVPVGVPGLPAGVQLAGITVGEDAGAGGRGRRRSAVILPMAVARGVADGTVTHVFRRWTRSRVRAGSTLRTAAGVVEVTGVTVVDEITDDDARGAGAASADAVRAAFRGTDGDPVFRIDLRFVGSDPRDALSAGLEPSEVDGITTRLERLDRASTYGAWTRTTLEAVAAHPGLRAADLAALLGRERDPFKLDVRKLKNLGLTHSLEVGYRISPRGVAYLAATSGPQR